MKLINKIIISLLFICAMNSCDHFDHNDLVITDEEWMFNSPVWGVNRLVSLVYARLGYDFGKYNGAMSASATDEAEYAISTSEIHKFYNGGWSPIVPFSNTWVNSYEAIADANEFLEKMEKLTLEEYLYKYTGETSYEILKSKYELYPYEVRFLRAYYYFELAKTYGDVPLVTKTLSNHEANSIKRTPVKEIFRYIVDECDAIAEYLPISYEDEPNQELGRANRPMALALKARTLLYAASPLFNPDNDCDLWLKAAEANKLVIDKCLEWGYRLSSYSALWGNDNHLNREVIFIRRTGSNNSFEKYNFPIGIENAYSGNCPTQNLVDAYEYVETGKTWPEMEAAGTLPEDPYEGLDPRFYLTVVKHGDSWPNNNPDPIEITEGGRNAPPLLNATTTGYYLKKYCDGTIDISTTSANTKYHSWIVYRLAEFYLNYAEAIYNYTGNADATAGGLTMTANEAINVLRSRSDIQMPLFTGNENFEKRYIRERMVELAFEDHRFWDVRRWKKGADFFTNISVMKFTRSGEQVIMTRENKTRSWNERNNLFPIPYTEIRINPNLTQNPGWE